MTRRGWLALATLGTLLACAEWAGPELAGGGPRLALVPVFSVTAGTVLFNDLDRLRVVVTGSGARAGVVVADTTVPVDTAGDATLTVPILLFGTTETYTVQLQGIRSADGAVLYSGSDTVTVQAGRATRVDSVPVLYRGPCQLGVGCVVSVAPQNLTLQQGGSFLMTVAVDSLGAVPVPNVPVRLANLTPGLIALASDLTVTALSGTSCGPARVAAAIPGAADTLRLGVSAPVTIPAVLFTGDSASGLSSGVFCNNTNGTGRFRVSAMRGLGDVNPRYSPDRQRVAYTFDSTGTSQLWVAGWAGDTNALVVSDTLGASRPRWSPNGLHLAYECGVAFPTNVCVIQDATGPILLLFQALRRVFNDVVPTRRTGPGSFAWDPRSPDRLAFALDSLTSDPVPKTTSALYVADFNGINVTPLTLTPLDFGTGVLTIRELDWSPRGDVIVFSATDTLSQGKLYAVNRDGTGVRQLTKGPGTDSDSRPVVSPDGNQVIFLRNTGGCSIDYWRIQIDGTGEQQVSGEGLCDISANQVGHDWSLDGKEIVLVGSEPPGGYNFSIYKVPAGVTPATYVKDRVLVSRADPSGFVNDQQPSWRP